MNNTNSSSDNDKSNENMEVLIRSPSSKSVLSYTYDDVLDEIGSFKKYQIFWFIIFGLLAALPNILVYSSSFVLATPDFECLDNLNDTDFNVSRKNFCPVTCTNFNYSTEHHESSIVVRWNLICDRAWIKSLIQTIYFLGVTVGSFVMGFIADKFGRRFALQIAIVHLLVFWMISSFVPLLDQHINMTATWTIYLMIQFVLGMGHFFVFGTCFMQISEMTGRTGRAFSSIIIEVWWASGEFVLLLFAYFIRDWFTLNICLASLMFLFLPLIYYAPESVRWLMVEQRFDEAHKIIIKIMKWNGSAENAEHWYHLVDCEKKRLAEENVTESNKSSILMTSLKEILHSRTMLIITIASYIVWLTSCMVYFGLGLNTGVLSGDPYLNFLIGAIVEVIGVILTYFGVVKLGRRLTTFLLFLVSGLTCISPLFFPKDQIDPNSPLANNHLINFVTCLIMVGKMAASGAFAVVFLLTLEMFPTSVRGVAIGTCSMWARIGAMLSPQINLLGEVVDPILPTIIFGGFGLIAAIVTLVLPETMNKPLTQTVKETERLYNFKKRYTKGKKKMRNFCQ
ncbi:hypothetical protein SNEBB_008630 [Seison nebaliae]|nr:hypothetical protein SNEBB_008630 [Seison nebaliae]